MEQPVYHEVYVEVSVLTNNYKEAQERVSELLAEGNSYLGWDLAWDILHKVQ